MSLFDTRTKRTARAAGLLYLIVMLTGIFSLGYVPARIVLSGPPALVASSLANAELLYRAGVVASILCFTAFLILPFALYRLLSPYGKHTGVLMVGVALVGAPIAFGSILHQFQVLSLLHDVGNVSDFEPGHVSRQIAAALEAHRDAIAISKISWGVWLLPLGLLVARSTILPRLLGMFLVLGACGYIADFLAGLLLPEYLDSAWAHFSTMPAALAQFALCMWLIVKAAREPAPAKPLKRPPATRPMYNSQFG